MNNAYETAVERFWRLSRYLLSGHTNSLQAEPRLRAIAEAAGADPRLRRLAAAAERTLAIHIRRREQRSAA